MTDSKPSDKPSSTPRTDKAEAECNCTVNGAVIRGLVTVEVTRQLERELAEARAEVNWAKNINASLQAHCELECVKHGCAKKYAAARDAVLEEAARIADDHEDHWRGRQRGSSYNIERKDEAGNIAAAIRALKGNAAPQVAAKDGASEMGDSLITRPAESASRCVVVPKEPTEAMCKAGALHCSRNSFTAMMVYEAMLAAAPSQSERNGEK